MPNRLAGETSPYLLQHAHNPVDWYPWGEEALARAKRENRPILLSIGYSACHWCHVMERESFEDPETARVMNERFVNIKVDREERPDLDSIYMRAVQALTGGGGWPMTVVLTPNGEPFFGGTYFPPVDRHGMPAFRRVLQAVSDAYAERQADVRGTVESLRQVLADATPRAAASALNSAFLDGAYRQFATEYDAQHGGFGGAPKFPQAMALEFALVHWARTGEQQALAMALDSFRAMARGGICDQVGGGFARYSTDGAWLVPHFEKMLYDNALIARLGVHLWQATHDAEVRRACEATFTWVAREMTAPGGGCYAALDADSEGEEGKFYVWTREEIDAATGEDAPMACAYFGVEPGGNWEGRSILHVPHHLEDAAAAAGVPAAAMHDAVERARGKLLAARARRVRPARDDKILAAWNGLMLRTQAEAARAFDSPSLRTAALAHGEFLFRELVRGGRVWRSYKDGVVRTPGFLDDHAAVALGALAVYELTFDRTWLGRARALGAVILEYFWNEPAGVFYDTAVDQERLIVRPRDASDNATPSGTSLAVELSLRLAALFDDSAYARRAERALAGLAGEMERFPPAFGHLLCAADLAVHGAVELAIVGDPKDTRFPALDRAAAGAFVPALVLAGGQPNENTDVPLLALRRAHANAPMAYLCRGYACDAPVDEPDALAAQLRAARMAPTR